MCPVHLASGPLVSRGRQGRPDLIESFYLSCARKEVMRFEITFSLPLFACSSSPPQGLANHKVIQEPSKGWVDELSGSPWQ